MNCSFYDAVTRSSTNISATVPHPNCKIANEVGIFLILVNVLTCLVGTLGNFLVFIALYKNESLRVVTNYFLFNLALADLFVTLMAQPLFCIRLYHTLSNSCVKDVRISYKLASSLSCFASVATLVCVSVDRFISLRYPLSYKDIVTKHRAFAMIAVVWIGAFSYIAILSAYNFKESTIWKAVTVSAFVVFYTTICAMHFSMYIITKRFIRRAYIQDQRQPDARKLQEVYKREKKAAKTVALVFVLFSISWLPYVIQTVVKSVGQLTLARDISYSLFTMALTNSSVNPIIYSFRNKQFRNAAKKLFRRGNQVGVYQHGSSTASAGKERKHTARPAKEAPI